MPRNKAGALGYLGHPLFGPRPDKQADIAQSSEKAHAHPPSSRMRSQQDRFLKKTPAGGKDSAGFESMSGQFPADLKTILPVQLITPSAEQTMPFHDNTDIETIPGQISEQLEETLRWAQSSKRFSALPFLLGWVYLRVRAGTVSAPMRAAWP